MGCLEFETENMRRTTMELDLDRAQREATRHLLTCLCTTFYPLYVRIIVSLEVTQKRYDEPPFTDRGGVMCVELHTRRIFRISMSAPDGQSHRLQLNGESHTYPVTYLVISAIFGLS